MSSSSSSSSSSHHHHHHHHHHRQHSNYNNNSSRSSGHQGRDRSPERPRHNQPSEGSNYFKSSSTRKEDDEKSLGDKRERPEVMIDQDFEAKKRKLDMNFNHGQPHVEPVAVEKFQSKKDANDLVFLSKEERRHLALEERQQEALLQKKKLDDARKQRQQFLEASKDALKSAIYDAAHPQKKDTPSSSFSSSSSPSPSSSSSSSSSSAFSRPVIKRDRSFGRASFPPPSSNTTEFDESKILQKEMEEIKKHYLGMNKPKKRSVKVHDRPNQVPDWDNDDDTTAEVLPLIKTKVEFRPAFGKGYIAGIDHDLQQDRVQRKIKEQVRKNPINLAQDSSSIDFLEISKNKSRAKNFDRHWTEKSLDEMTERDWRIFKEDFNITTRGGSIPNCLRNWEDAKLPESIRKAIQTAGYKEPTPIQKASIPIGLQGRDIVGIAETGSGKTLAFVIPMLVYIGKMPKMTPEIESDGPYALILAPTRELAIQINQETRKLADHCGIRTVCLVGGQSIEEQGVALRKGCEVIIATPGRIQDCLESRFAVLNQCNYLVLDEADKMVEMGFESQLTFILNSMPSTSMKSEDENVAEMQEKSTERVYRTTIMFSATMPPPVERLSRAYLRRAAYVSIGEIGKTVDRIEQRVMFVHSENEKRTRLMDLVKNGPSPPVIIFANKKRSCDSIKDFLDKEGYRVTVLHSGKSQDQRETSFDNFKKGVYDYLVATDVAGRGLDVKGVTHVINYDLPLTIDTYTHRIGRTGRAGMTGLATSLIAKNDTAILYDLKQLLIKSKNSVIPDELRRHPMAQFRQPVAPRPPRHAFLD